MNEVHALAVLGAGGFGQVLLVKYRAQHLALKCVAKSFVQVMGCCTFSRPGRLIARAHRTGT